MKHWDITISEPIRLEAAVVGSGAAGLNGALQLHKYGVQNTGNITWPAGGQPVRLGIADYSIIGLYHDAACTTGDTSNRDRINIKTPVELGGTYTFVRLVREAGSEDIGPQKEVYTARETDAAITVDGAKDADEWSDAETIVVNPASKVVHDHGFNWQPATLQTEADLKSESRMKWDNEYLYILEERTDNGHVGTSKTGGIDWTVDAGITYLDTDGNWNGATYYAGDAAVYFTTTTDGTPNV